MRHENFFWCVLYINKDRLSILNTTYQYIYIYYIYTGVKTVYAPSVRIYFAAIAHI